MHRALIIGTHETARIVAAELKANSAHGFVPAGFIEDRPSNAESNGIPILGSLSDLAIVAKAHDVRHVVTDRQNSATSLRELFSVCRREQLTIRIAVFNGGPADSIDQRTFEIRPVQIEDLLRHGQIQPNGNGLEERIRRQRVLVTGAGGSIGSELCRQIARYQPAQLILLGHGEHSIFTLASELSWRFPSLSIVRVIADVRDQRRLEQAFSDLLPTMVFHTAAHKHVALMEENIEEAVTNNVLGTRNLVNAGLAAGVQSFVLISTDKAVKPTSVMGATKRIAELIVGQADRLAEGSFVSVRFGNVLGSRGSVLGIFREQIARGGPVTVTHPEMSRYFMTIDEAVHLVLQATMLGEGGETFVLDMGEPIKIVDIARDLIELSGFEVDQDISIKFTGVRPGEKLTEELILESNDYKSTSHPKIYVLRKDTCASSETEAASTLNNQLTELVDAARHAKRDLIQHYLKRIVPEYEGPATLSAGVQRAH